MATFSEQITIEGHNLLAKMLTGEANITFTKMVLGDGNVTVSEMANIRQVVSPKVALDIHSVLKDASNNVTITSIFSNEEMEQGFYYREKGLYATDGENEILFLYGNNGTLAEWINPGGSQVVEKKIISVLTFSETQDVKVTIKSGVYVTSKELELHNTNEEAHPNIMQKINNLEVKKLNCLCSSEQLTDNDPNECLDSLFFAKHHNCPNSTDRFSIKQTFIDANFSYSERSQIAISHVDGKQYNRIGWFDEGTGVNWSKWEEQATCKHSKTRLFPLNGTDVTENEICSITDIGNGTAWLEIELVTKQVINEGVDIIMLPVGLRPKCIKNVNIRIKGGVSKTGYIYEGGGVEVSSSLEEGKVISISTLIITK